MRRNYILIFIIVIILVYLGNLAKGLNPYFYQLLVFWGINSILALSLNLINGFAGQFSIGHAGFMAVGGYFSSALSVYQGEKIISLLNFLPLSVAQEIVFFVFLILGGLISAILGLIVGIPTLRLKGDYLAIATLGFSEIVRVAILNLDVVGGPRGFPGIPQRTNLSWVILWFIICLLLIRNLINSSHGRAIISIREDEIASETMGINTTFYKVLAFVIGAFFAGIAGGLFAHYLMMLHPSSFTFFRSVEILLMIVLGGMGSITGSILGAFMLTILPEALRGFTYLRLIIYSIILIGIMLLRPQGIMGGKEFSFSIFRKIYTRVNKNENIGSK
ncbi:MAG: branched-chain amino acid ABC transporter permease [Dictyoglomus sp.]|nr:branched-chain amino acid ABC transporter permease [Dictyoglomus sp.]MCX7942393.1 branched-chain amino acid ABC transporter permease [Dictyoglomaceae bacterium]MDW8188946.1 branched-chain amino acid ABC transporter permease [Dictyoglomus sp.]